MTLLYSSNFDADTDGSLPSGWAFPSGAGYGGIGTSNAVSGAKSFGLNGSSTAVYTAAAVQTVQRIQFAQKGVWNDIGPVMRADATLQNGYRWKINGPFGGNNGSAVLQKQIAGGGWSDLLTQFNVTLGASVTVVEALSNGNVHELRVWDGSDSKPGTPTATYTDSTSPIASGLAGVFNGGGGSVQFDDFFYYSDNGVVQVAPAFSTAPAITGTPAPGSASSYTSGTVTGTPTPTITQQWTIDGVDISGATGATYTPVSADSGKALRVRQIATNSEGNASSTSAPVTVASVVIFAVTSVATTTGGGNLLVNCNKAIGPANGTSGSFVFSIPSSAFAVSGGHTVTGQANSSTDTQFVISVSPAVTTGEVVTLSYVKPASGNMLRDASGNAMESFGPIAIANNSITAAPINPPPTSDTINIKTAGAGWDFPTVADLDTYIGNLDCVALGKLTVIYVYDNFDIGGRMFAPKTSNDSCYVVMYPAPGQSVNDGLTDAYTGDYGNKGITLSVTNNEFNIGIGMSIQGFRMRGTSNNNSQLLTLSPGRSSGRAAELRYNRFWFTSTRNSMFSSQYNAPNIVHDNYFLFDGAYTGTVWTTYGQVDCQRNTFVRKNGGAYTGALLQANATFRDNVVLGFGPDPITGVGNYPNRANNYVDYPQTTADAAFIVGTTSALVVSLDDARPAVGSPIIGGGSSTAISINDLRGGNRGPTPDAGAFQRTAATPLVVATVTSQVIDGQSLIISGTTTNTPTSSLLTLSPAATPNGAQFYGPLTVTLGSGAFTVTVDDIATGAYVPSMSMTNGGGTSMVNGLAGFEIMGLESVAQDPVNAGPATAFTWLPPTTGTAGVQSAPFPVGVDGTLSATVRFTPSDNGAGGTFTPAFLDLTSSAPTGTMRYMRPTAGSSTLAAVSAGSLLSPPAATYTAAPAQTVPSAAPTISISTASTAILSGKNATISGPANLQGDAAGHVDLFLDPQPSGTSVALGVAPLASGIWIKQAVIPAGLYRLRAVATANGQTATASTADLRVLGLTGTVGIPVA